MPWEQREIEIEDKYYKSSYCWLSFIYRRKYSCFTWSIMSKTTPAVSQVCGQVNLFKYFHPTKNELDLYACIIGLGVS